MLPDNQISPLQVPTMTTQESACLRILQIHLLAMHTGL
jgi:hypothetical protein